MNITISKTSRPQRLLSCPYCRSVEIGSNELGGAPFFDMARGALTSCRAGQSGRAARTVLAWASVAFANLLRDDHVCLSCGESFGETKR